MIRELYQKGWTQTAIAKETGFDRKTIRKYLKGDKLPERKANGKQKASKLDPYKNYLLQRIQEGTTNCVVLFEETSVDTPADDILKIFVRPYREQPKKPPCGMKHHRANKHKWTGPMWEVFGGWSIPRHLCFRDGMVILE